MKIKVLEESSNRIFELEIEPSTSVDVIKLKLSATQNLNYNLVLLKLNGQILVNASATAQSLGLAEGGQITLALQKGK